MSVDVFDRHGQQRDLDWLKATYGATVLDAGPGKKFKLVRVDETEGPATFIVEVRNEQGKPDELRPVANHWPGVEHDDKVQRLSDDPNLKSRWHGHALVQKTNSNGDTGFGFGGGDIIRDGRGAHTFWVLSPSLPSDALTGVGWLTLTNHRGPCRMTFQIAEGATGPGDGEPGDEPDDDGQNPPDTELLARLNALHADLKKLMKHLGAG